MDGDENYDHSGKRGLSALLSGCVNSSFSVTISSLISTLQKPRSRIDWEYMRNLLAVHQLDLSALISGILIVPLKCVISACIPRAFEELCHQSALNSKERL